MPQIAQIIGSILLACVPAFIWGYIYYHKKPEDKRLTAMTFIVGSLAVFPILLYKLSWHIMPWINAFRWTENYTEDIISIAVVLSVPLSVVLTFMLVGAIEESVKLFSVKIVDDDELKSVDDSMEFFILAALGFAFTENVLYFYNIWVSQGPNYLFLPFLFRSSFSTFAHIMFSGILGYYYGTAHFAKPILQQEIRENRQHWTKWFNKIFKWRKTRLFYQQRILEGLLISIGLHALFNIFLEMNLTYLVAPFLVGGYFALNYLFAQKENQKQYNKLLTQIRNH